MVAAAPPLIVAWFGLKTALAPLVGGVKKIRPPLTGLPAWTGVTLTDRLVANGAVATVLWLPPAVTARVKPDVSKAPMSTVPLTFRLKPLPR